MPNATPYTRSKLVGKIDSRSSKPVYSSTGYTLSGTAVQESGFVRLTQLTSSQAGQINFVPKVDLSFLYAFEWLLKYRIYGGSPGADGIFLSLKDSVADKAVEIHLDTYLNPGDPAAENIKVITQSSTLQQVATPTRTDTNGAYLWVNYDSANLRIYRSTENIKPSFPVLTQSINIPSNFTNPPSFSLSGNTGGAHDYHDIFSFNWDKSKLI